MEGFPSVVATIAGSALVALLTAYFTARFSIGRFHSQRWWELKAEAYSKIVKHLSYMRYCSSRYLADMDGTEDMDSEISRDLSMRFREAREFMEKAAAEGSYIISPRAAEELSKLASSFYRASPDPYAQELRDIDAITQCLSVMKEEARRELRAK